MSHSSNFFCSSCQKTKQRNRFSTEGVARILFTKQDLNGNCFTFNPSAKMIARFDATIYKNVTDALGNLEDSV